MPRPPRARVGARPRVRLPPRRPMPGRGGPKIVYCPRGAPEPSRAAAAAPGCGAGVASKPLPSCVQMMRVDVIGWVALQCSCCEAKGGRRRAVAKPWERAKVVLRRAGAGVRAAGGRGAGVVGWAPPRVYSGSRGQGGRGPLPQPARVPGWGKAVRPPHGGKDAVWTGLAGKGGGARAWCGQGALSKAAAQEGRRRWGQNFGPGAAGTARRGGGSRPAVAHGAWRARARRARGARLFQIVGGAPGAPRRGQPLGALSRAPPDLS
jgi:hypothetical protein